MLADMQRNQTGEPVRQLQRHLMELGFHLRHFGADGHLGDETYSAIVSFARQLNLSLPPGPVIPASIIGAIYGVEHQIVPVDLTEMHTGLQWRLRKVRTWPQITGITLHQTAVLLGEAPQRWYSLKAHLGITRGGRALMVCPLQRAVWHGNGLNATDVGIELDGYFEGIEGQPNTLWNPPTDPNRRALTPTQEQIEATRRAIRWICDTVKRNGGNIQFIHAHRQSSNQRQSDPGSFIWREVGLWAQRELGLSDGGRNFTLGTGLRIPEAWDRSRKGIAY
jgi:peptidoglycan hydrolase-like protein with peptidoglycan-binding domain